MAHPISVSLIGVPTDVGAGHRGARLGPEALRVAGLPEDSPLTLGCRCLHPAQAP